MAATAEKAINPDIKAKFKVDIVQLDKLAKGVSGIRKDFEWLNTNLKSINAELNKTLTNLQQMEGLGPNGMGSAKASAGAVKLPLTQTATSAAQNAIASGNTSTQSIYKTVNIINKGMDEDVANGGRGGREDGVAAKGARVWPRLMGQAVALAIQTIDNRTNSAYGRVLSNDKLTNYMMQTRGLTQMQAMDLRTPISKSKLGVDGTSTMLALQQATGLNANLNAGAVEGMRALSGWSQSTGQIAGMMQSLSSAQVNNRMTMTLGTGMYGPGGKQRDIGEVIRNITKGSGLTNENVLKGARQAGSVTRARLSSMGVPEDMIDTVLDYAESNVQYQKKTGKTDMYDPSKKKDRTTMGIEDTFATQAEETTRVKESREDKFARRQVDNYADLEVATQKLTQAMGGLEDFLSSAIGLRTSTKNTWQSKVLGYGMAAVGMGITAGTLGGGAPLGMGLIAGGLTIANTGDPVPGAVGKNQTGAKVPMGYARPPGRVSLGELTNSATFRPLNSRFKNQLLAMMQENPNVGIGQGHRSASEQATMFFSRYKKAGPGEKGEVSYRGEEYIRHSGAPAMPPGKSMHEIGLAADLVGDLDWVQENAARFGLKTFGDVNNEPWHVQPAELPNGRWEYEKIGAPWGLPAGAKAYEDKLDANGNPVGGGALGDTYQRDINTSSGSGSTVGRGLQTFNQIGIGAGISAILAENRTHMGGATGSTGGNGLSVSSTSTGRSTPQSAGTGGSMKAMDPIELAGLMHKRGFKGKDLVNMLAIAGRESNWIPGVYNGKGPDRSYGLFQINMLGKMGEARRERYKIATNEELYDPATNVKAARLEFGGGNYVPWNKRGNPMNDTEAWYPKAQAAVKAGGFSTGDPITNAPQRGGTNVTVAGGSSVTIAPNIYMTSTGSTTNDAHAIAQRIARILETDLKREVLRTT